MNIFLITSVYSSQYAPYGTTPVIHRFTKEWVIQGHKVDVFHTESSFPKAFYLFRRLFKKLLDSKLGHWVPIRAPKEYDE